MRRVFMLLAATMLAACVTVGSKFNIKDADQLRPGVSTQADAVRLLGPPTSKSALASGTLLQWQYSRGTLAGGVGAHLAVLFDPQGQMVRVTHRASFD